MVHSIDMTEEVYFHDSSAIVNFIAMLDGAAGNAIAGFFASKY